MGEKAFSQPFGHQQRLVNTQMGGPQTVFGQAVLVVHKSGLLEKRQVALKVFPQMPLGRALPFYLGAVLLIGRQRFMQKIFDLPRSMREQQIEGHGEVDANLAVNRGRGGFKKSRHLAHIHVLTRHHQGEPDVVFSAPAGPTGHLLQFGGVQGEKFTSVEAIGVQESHRARWKIYTGCHCRGGENGIQQPFAHQGFQHQFPGRQLPAMVRSHRHLFQHPTLAMASNVGLTGHEFVDSALELLHAMRIGDLVFKAQLDGAVAIGPGFKKENGRQQLVFAQYFQDIAKRREFAGGGQGLLAAGIEKRHHFFVEAATALSATFDQQGI